MSLVVVLTLAKNTMISLVKLTTQSELIQLKFLQKLISQLLTSIEARIYSKE
jgi:hypothetical protein